MQYRRMGSSGLKLSALSFGSWVTFGGSVGRNEARNMLAFAYDQGVNFFDNAEFYARGESERIMGDVLADLRFARDSYCVSSKVFFGAVDQPKPTQQGLSRKHVFDACHQALQRLRVDYLDLYFCHRPDPDCPIEETVLAMDALIRQGKVLYWGTSEWSASDIEYACAFAESRHLHPPQMEQPQYNLIHRERVEVEYAELYKKRGLGTTIWSPLASGLLSGKYQSEVPEDSRLNAKGYEWLRRSVLNQDAIRREKIVKEMAQIAAQLTCSMAQVALLWCLKNPNVSSVLLGASKLSQLQENLACLQFLEQTQSIDWSVLDVSQH